MSTARDLIQAALEELGVYAPGETLTEADASRGLWVLNAMLDSWSNENLFCYAIQEFTVPLVIGQNQYSIGPSGQVNGVRPLRAITGLGAAYVVDGSQNRYPVDVIERDQWNRIGLLTANSQIPTRIFYDPQFPLGILNVFPMPASSYDLYFDAYLQLSDFGSLTTVLTLPPGYQDAIQHNLAIRLKPFFATGQIDPIIIELASQTKAAVKRTNIKQSPASYDASIISRATPTYNIFRDSSNST